MDVGMGKLVPVSDKFSELLEQQPTNIRGETLKERLFKEGEVVQVKCSMFQILRISRHTLTLRLLPDTFKL